MSNRGPKYITNRNKVFIWERALDTYISFAAAENSYDANLIATALNEKEAAKE